MTYVMQVFDFLSRFVLPFFTTVVTEAPCLRRNMCSCPENADECAAVLQRATGGSSELLLLGLVGGSLVALIVGTFIYEKWFK